MVIEKSGMLIAGKSAGLSDAWLTKLRGWNVPYADDLALTLEGIGLDPISFKNPIELYNNLSQYMKTLQADQSLIFEECFPPPGFGWYCPIVHFLNYVYIEYIQPYIGFVGIMAVGGVATWLLPQRWKVVGVGAVIAGMLGIYKTITTVEV